MRPPKSAGRPLGRATPRGSVRESQTNAEILAGHVDWNEPRSRLLRAREAQTYLGLSARTLWSLTNTGQILHVRIGRSVRYDLHDLEKWIAKHKRGGGA